MPQKKSNIKVRSKLFLQFNFIDTQVTTTKLHLSASPELNTDVEEEIQKIGIKNSSKLQITVIKNRLPTSKMITPNDSGKIKNLKCYQHY